LADILRPQSFEASMMRPSTTGCGLQCPFRHLLIEVQAHPLQDDRREDGGKERQGGISKQGDRTLRRLLVLSATAVIRHARTKAANEASWLKGLLERRPAKLAAVAQANKTARIVWALLVRGGTYRAPAAAQAATA
jgi:transposase